MHSGISKLPGNKTFGVEWVIDCADRQAIRKLRPLYRTIRMKEYSKVKVATSLSGSANWWKNYNSRFAKTSILWYTKKLNVWLVGDDDSCLHWCFCYFGVIILYDRKIILETASSCLRNRQPRSLSYLEYVRNSFGRVNTNCLWGSFRSTFSERRSEKSRSLFWLQLGQRYHLLQEKGLKY